MNIIIRKFIIILKGYKHKKAFIVAQNPMESTARDFWKVVKDRECTVVVMLCNLEENGQVSSNSLPVYIHAYMHMCRKISCNVMMPQEACHQYWPSTVGKQHYGDLFVEKVQENKYSGYTERILSITNKVGNNFFCM